jgi:hypothetical protein
LPLIGVGLVAAFAIVAGASAGLNWLANQIEGIKKCRP